VVGAAGEGRTGYIAEEDVADVTAALLTQPEKHGVNKHYAFSGPATVTDGEVIKAVSDALGKPVKYTSIAPEAFKARLVGFGLPPPVADFLTLLETVRLNSIAGHVTDSVEKVLGRKPLSAAEWAKRHVKDFQ